ncbi:MAG TPA: M60 family metallopeptidase [Polyangiaceae bacterium]|nr:M60 family metallopeptidase [Polyangiaceae bacterium]
MGALGGASSGGGSTAGGSGDAPAVEACGSGAWSCVPVDGAAPYGAHTFDVPAQQNWVNTGLYLRRGETASLTETGTWRVSDTGDSIDHGTCKVGDLVARIGLHYKDTALTCVKGSATFTAPKDGILFVGALAGNDLGETYETRHNASGKKSVTVTSTHASVPTVLASEASNFAFTDVASGWVEVWGKHVILALPIASAQKDAQIMARAAKRLDAIYEFEAELRSALPHNGQRIRFFPDGTQPGYMLAGNPIRMELTLVTGGDETRISRAGETGTDIWGFAHELGHDFTFAPNGFWTYQENTLESWCNLFSIYALEKLNLPLNDSTTDCSAQSTGNYDDWDAWGGLCFLRQFQFRYGWDFYREYFKRIKDTTSTDGDPWTFVHGKFESIAGKDVTPLFDAWNVPHP